jgi:hypothetical protein
MLRRLVCFTIAVGVGCGTAAAADGFDPSTSCSEVLSGESGIPEVAVGFWAFGFLAAANDRPETITPELIGTMLDILRERCAAAPTASLAQIAREMAAAEAEASPGQTGDVAADGREFLLRFLDDGEDRQAMTLALKPTPEDVRTVYAEPLASRLIDAYDGLFVAGAVIQPKPGQTELLSVFTTTGALKRGDPVLAEFPGGYKDVLDYIVGDVPIARFKFVEPGEDLGLAFDGLVHVNGRWVFMPKPWNGL